MDWFPYSFVILYAAFIAKHYLADFLCQTTWMARGESAPPTGSPPWLPTLRPTQPHRSHRFVCNPIFVVVGGRRFCRPCSNRPWEGAFIEAVAPDIVHGCGMVASVRGRSGSARTYALGLRLRPAQSVTPSDPSVPFPHRFVPNGDKLFVCLPTTVSSKLQSVGGAAAIKMPSA